uniref:hypothetical protein n=1 Tax=Escherichia coli TaxID=562 RepID=UPI002A59D036|nr:hypothetical protein [Escherichia coli]
MDLKADFSAVFISENLYSIDSKSFMAFLITLFCTLTDDLRLSRARSRSMLTGPDWRVVPQRMCTAPWLSLCVRAYPASLASGLAYSQRSKVQRELFLRLDLNNVKLGI